MVPFDLYIQQHALMVTSDFEVVQTVLKVEWKFATIMHGALCVMTSGVHLMQELHVDSLDFHQQVCNCMCMLIESDKIVSLSYCIVEGLSSVKI